MAKSLSAIDRRLQGLLGKAIRHFEMIEAGDRVAVAVSGGKDSLALLYMLKARLKWIPVRYELLAVHLDMGFEGTFPLEIERFCQDLNVPFHFERTAYGLEAHSPENRENPCFLCAWKRRKHLFQLSEPLNFNKLALGHNKDDLIETLFLNMFYSGELSTMMPRQSLFNQRLTLIRPLILIDEKEIKAFARRKGFPELPNLCPSTGRSSRQGIKEILNGLYAGNRKIKGNIFHALSHCRPEYLPSPLKKSRS
ncbi:MAG: ATP-binding protein [Thermodesulfobacteriota bacterium]